MKIKNRESYLNTTKEATAPTSNFSKTIHWLYLLFVTILVCYFLYRVYLFLFTYDGSGNVLVEKVNVSPSYDGTVFSLPVKTGQLVPKNATLFTTKPAVMCEFVNQSYGMRVEQLSYEIHFKEAQVDLLKKQPIIARKMDKFDYPPIYTHDKLLLHRALEAGAGDFEKEMKGMIAQNNDQYRRQEQVAQETQKVNYQIALLLKDIETQRELLKNLQLQAKNQSPTINCENETVIAPFNGIIRRVFFQSNEFVKRGEPVIVIEKLNPTVEINAFFDLDDLRYLAINAPVTVTFPDGQSGKGLIKEIYSAAFAFSDPKLVVYEPSDARVSTRIIPIDAKEAEQWKKYNLLQVDVSGFKHSWF